MMIALILLIVDRVLASRACSCAPNMANSAVSGDSCAAEVKMYGNVTPSGMLVKWHNFTVKVPRCGTCRAAHARGVDFFTTCGAVLGGLVGFGGCLFNFIVNEVELFGCLIVISICAAIGTGIGAAIDSAFSPKGITPESTKTEFSSVKKRIAEGWALGEKPPGVE